MSHNWHEDTLEDCLIHAQSFTTSVHRMLLGDHISMGMQNAVADDIQNILEDIARCIELHQGGPSEKVRDSYVQHLEGVVFVQLHQIQQLQKEVALHAAPA